MKIRIPKEFKVGRSNFYTLDENGVVEPCCVFGHYAMRHDPPLVCGGGIMTIDEREFRRFYHKALNEFGISFNSSVTVYTLNDDIEDDELRTNVARRALELAGIKV